MAALLLALLVRDVVTLLLGYVLGRVRLVLLIMKTFLHTLKLFKFKDENQKNSFLALLPRNLFAGFPRDFETLDKEPVKV